MVIEVMRNYEISGRRYKLKKKKTGLELSFRLVGRNKKSQDWEGEGTVKKQKTVSGKPSEESASRRECLKKRVVTMSTSS